jgi:hypothetical protein
MERLCLLGSEIHGTSPSVRVFIFRLIDNEQFLFGQSLKARESFRDRISTAAKKFYLTKCSITIFL